MAREMIPNLSRDLVGGGVAGGRHVSEGGEDREALIEAHQNMNTIDITHIAGVIAQEDINRLRRLIFRSTKGKSYIHIKPYEDPNPIPNEKVT